MKYILRSTEHYQWLDLFWLEIFSILLSYTYIIKKIYEFRIFYIKYFLIARKLYKKVLKYKYDLCFSVRKKILNYINI